MFSGISGAPSPLITVWLQVRVLPRPPRNPRLSRYSSAVPLSYRTRNAACCRSALFCHGHQLDCGLSFSIADWAGLSHKPARQNRCPLLQNTLMFDPVQVPSLRHAFQSVNAAILEADSRLRHQVLDRARDQDFAGTRFRGDARADVKRETDQLGPAHFIFARMQPHPDL